MSFNILEVANHTYLVVSQNISKDLPKGHHRSVPLQSRLPGEERLFTKHVSMAEYAYPSHIAHSLDNDG